MSIVLGGKKNVGDKSVLAGSVKAADADTGSVEFFTACEVLISRKPS
jgi:hypothetical protein